MKRICETGLVDKEIADMTVSALLTLTIVVALFAALAGGLAWAQQHARQLTTAPANVPRRKRRPF